MDEPDKIQTDLFEETSQRKYPQENANSVTSEMTDNVTDDNSIPESPDIDDVTDEMTEQKTTQMPEQFQTSAPIPEPVTTPKPSPPPVNTHSRRRTLLPLNPVVFSLPDEYSEDGVSSGTIMRYAREQSGITLDEAASATRIRIEYIISLEDDSFKGMPGHAFIQAYIRNLGALYGLDKAGILLAQERLERQPEKSNVQSIVIKDVAKDGIVNESEQKRVKRMFYIASAVIGVLLILGAWAVIAAVLGWEKGDELTVDISGTGTEAAAEPPVTVSEAVPGVTDFNSVQLEELIAPQMPEASVLDFSPVPRVKR